MVVDSRPRRVAIRRSSPAALHTNERSTDARRRGCRGSERCRSERLQPVVRTYSTLDGVSRVGRPPAPRARWANPQGTPKDKWLGRYAVPVPQSVTPHAARATEGLRTGVETWAYGDVAEILHEGSYGAEQPDIERLLRFIESSGYRVIGDHEEEYVKGPGIFFAGRSRQIPDYHSTAR